MENSLSEAPLRSSRFPDLAQAIKAVKSIYDAGAEEVHVEYDESTPNHSNTLLVIGKKGMSTKTFVAILALNPDELHYYREERLWKLKWE